MPKEGIGLWVQWQSWIRHLYSRSWPLTRPKHGRFLLRSPHWNGIFSFASARLAPWCPMTARLAAAKMPSNFTSQSQQIDSFPSAPSHLTVDSRNHPWMEKQRPPGEKEKRKTWVGPATQFFSSSHVVPCLPGPLYRHATDSDNFCPSDNSQSQSVSAVRSTRKTQATRFHLKIPLAVAQKLNNFFCICGVWWFLQNSAPARLQESFTTFLFPMDIIQPSWTKRFWPPFRSRSCTISCPGCEHIYWLAYQRVLNTL